MSVQYTVSVCYVNIPVSSLTFPSTFASERLGHGRPRGHAAAQNTKTIKPTLFPNQPQPSLLCINKLGCNYDRGEFKPP